MENESEVDTKKTQSDSKKIFKVKQWNPVAVWEWGSDFHVALIQIYYRRYN